MNQQQPSISIDHALPEFDPPADLWDRIERRHAGNRRRRRLGVAVGVGAALVLAISAPRFSPLLEHAPSIDTLAQQRSEAGQLERDWQAMQPRSVSTGTAAATAYVALRPFDVALQQAYDRRASGEELSQLWIERNRVLRELIHGRRTVYHDIITI